MNFEFLECSDPAEWGSDLFLFSYSLFITPQWLGTLQSPTVTPLYLNCTLGAKVVAKMAGLRIEPTNRRKRVLFFYGLPAVRPGAEGFLQPILDALMSYASSNKFNRLVVRAYDSPSLLTTTSKKFHLSHQDEYIVNLAVSADQLQKGFHKKSILDNVKTAKKKGAVFSEENSPDQIERLVVLLEEAKTLRMSKGYEHYSYFYVPYLDKAILHKTLDNGMARIFQVKINDQTACVNFVLAHGKRVYALLVGTNIEGYKFGVPAFMSYSTINRCKDLGFES